MLETYDYVVYIGRFEPPHSAHIQTMLEGINRSRERLIVLAGSSNQPRTFKNPWTVTERESMIRDSLPHSLQDKIEIIPVSDVMYNDALWLSNVQNIIASKCQSGKTVAIIGHDKDSTSAYLQWFPQWEQIVMPNIDDLNATDIRDKYFTKGWNNEGDSEIAETAAREYDELRKHIPEGIHIYLDAFSLTSTYDELVAEHRFIQKYREAAKHRGLPYSPKFVTSDAVVIQSGHILLVKRRSYPGKGLWALPGGHVEDNETMEDAAINELRQETKLKVPEPVLRGSIKAREVFDAPGRSLRGRTFTQAFLFELSPGPLPKVKGSDDAQKAQWVQLNVFKQMEDQLFEDHFHIVNKMLGNY